MRLVFAGFLTLCSVGLSAAEHPVGEERKKISQLETLLSEKKYGEAAEYGQALSREYPENHSILYLSGIALLYSPYETLQNRDKSFSTALQYLQKSEKIFSLTPLSREKYQKTLFYTGLLYQLTGNYDMAIGYYTKLTATDPAEAEAWYNMGVCFHEKGNLIEANRAWLKYFEALRMREEDF